MFPKDESTANVGIGISLDRLKDRAEIKGYLDSWIAKDKRMRKTQCLDIVTGGVSTCAPIDETVRPGIALVGDAARLIDPITGGGIGNGCRAGMTLGQVLGEAAQSGDWSLDQLKKYEKGWRTLLEEGLYRNWMAKNKLVTMTDEEFDLIISTLAEVGVEKLSIHRILKVIKDRHPQLVEKFMDLI